MLLPASKFAVPYHFLDNVILTAAHCLEKKCFDKDTFYVLAGVLDLRFGGGVSRRISETHTHPNYKVIVLIRIIDPLARQSFSFFRNHLYILILE